MNYSDLYLLQKLLDRPRVFKNTVSIGNSPVRKKNGIINIRLSKYIFNIRN